MYIAGSGLKGPDVTHGHVADAHLGFQKGGFLITPLPFRLEVPHLDVRAKTGKRWITANALNYVLNDFYQP